MPVEGGTVDPMPIAVSEPLLARVIGSITMPFDCSGTFNVLCFVCWDFNIAFVTFGVVPNEVERE